MHETQDITHIHIITKGTWGGAQTYVYDLITEAVRRGFKTKLIYGEHGELVERLKSLQIECVQVPSLARDVRVMADIQSLHDIYRIMRKHPNDVIHLHSSKVGLLGSIAGALARCKNVFFTAHGWPHNERRPELQKLIFKTFEWLTIALSKKTIAVSDAVRVQAPSIFLDKKVVTIHNGIEAFPLFGKENAREALGIRNTSHPFVFGTIAELHTNKGIDILIQAFAKIHARHPQTALCIMGEGEERRYLENLISKEKLTDCIHLLGHIPNAREYIKACTVFVLPSRTEALGYALLEAGIAKIPCIASRVGGIPEIIEHKKTGLLVSPNDARELSLAMQFALERKEELTAYGQNLHTLVHEKYSKKNMLDSILDLYSTSH